MVNGNIGERNSQSGAIPSVYILKFVRCRLEPSLAPDQPPPSCPALFRASTFLVLITETTRGWPGQAMTCCGGQAHRVERLHGALRHDACVRETLRRFVSRGQRIALVPCGHRTPSRNPCRYSTACERCQSLVPEMPAPWCGGRGRAAAAGSGHGKRRRAGGGRPGARSRGVAGQAEGVRAGPAMSGGDAVRDHGNGPNGTRARRTVSPARAPAPARFPPPAPGPLGTNMSHYGPLSGPLWATIWTALGHFGPE